MSTVEPKILDFQLSKKLEYASGGEFSQTATLTFRAPGMDVYDDLMSLSEIVTASFVDASRFASANPPTEQDDTTLDGDAVKVVLLSTGKFVDVANQFRKIAIKTGTCDGKEKLTNSLLLKLSVADFNRLICEYIAVFIVPSLGLAGG